MKEKIKLITFKDDLSEQELKFITTKYTDLKQSLLKIYKFLGMIYLFIVLISFYLVISNVDETNVYEVKQKQQTIEYAIYFLPALIIAFLLICLLHFSVHAGGHRADIKNKMKYIEYAIIKRKKIMPSNNSFHFYIISDYKTNLEVDQITFEQYHVGDQITIEYLPQSKIFLGYY